MVASPKHIVIIGPAWPLRGGLATFNERMARQFINEGDNVTIFSFSLQYPSLLFPGKTQYSKDTAPTGLHIKPRVNSINPISWYRVGNEIKKARPDLVIIRYWLPFMAPALGSIARLVRKNKYSKVVALVDNLLPHENRIGDKQLTHFFVQPFDAFVTMSQTVYNDTKSVTNSKVIMHEHPLIDNFDDALPKAEARKILQLPENEKYILFFGFIRKYKGLDILIQALKIIKDRKPELLPKLLVAGEFYEEEEKYRTLISSLGLQDNVILYADFIPNDRVKYFLSACDFLVQPYKTATQSGVTPLAYHFEKPVLVTDVGGLPDIVIDGKTGVITQPTATSVAEGIERLYALNENELIAHVKAEKEKYSWHSFTQAIKTLSLHS